jgi:hypothetical protein
MAYKIEIIPAVGPDRAYWSVYLGPDRLTGAKVEGAGLEDVCATARAAAERAVDLMLKYCGEYPADS